MKTLWTRPTLLLLGISSGLGIQGCGGVNPNAPLQRPLVKKVEAPRIRYRANATMPPRLRLITDDEELSFDRYNEETPRWVLPNGSLCIFENHRRYVASLSEFRQVDAQPSFDLIRARKDGKGFYLVGTLLPTGRRKLYSAPAFDQEPKIQGEVVATPVVREALLYASTTDEIRFLDMATDRDIPFPREAEDDAVFGAPLRYRARDRSKKGGEWILELRDRQWHFEPRVLTEQPDGQWLALMDLGSVQRPRNICVRRLDHAGASHLCSEPPPPPQASPQEQRRERRHRHHVALRTARALSTGEFLVASDSDSALHRTDEMFQPKATFPSCNLLATDAASTRCTNVHGESIDRDMRRELERPTHSLKTIERSFFAEESGGVALVGSCDGSLANMACVRSANGEYRNIAYSSPVIDLLNRTKEPVTLLPRPDGDLYLVAGDLLTEHDTPIKIFHVASGRNVDVRPPHIEPNRPAQRGGVVPISEAATQSDQAGAVGYPRDDDEGPILFWRDDRTVSLWPVLRVHPAYNSRQTCRIDVSVSDGSTHVDCVLGTVTTAGRFGLHERESGVLLETIDAGETWRPIELPKDAPTGNVVCGRVGCRIGPYVRTGLGAALGPARVRLDRWGAYGMDSAIQFDTTKPGTYVRDPRREIGQVQASVVGGGGQLLRNLTPPNWQ